MPDEFPPTSDHPDDAALPSDSQPRDTDEPSRRSFLASAGTTAAGLAATAGLGVTAGCVEVLPAMGQEVTYESVAMPDARPPRYREWVQARDLDAEDALLPDIVAIPNNDSEAVTGVRMNTGRGFLAGRLDYFGVGFDNYDAAFSLFGDTEHVVVLEGPVAPSEVGSVLRETGYEADGTDRGYHRYVREDVPRTVAVGEGRILFAKGDERDAAIERALDNYEEDSPSSDEHPGFHRVTERTGMRPFVFLGTSFSGLGDQYAMDWSAAGLDYDEDGFYYFTYLWFTDDRPSREELRDNVESLEITEDADAVEIERDGQFAAVEVNLSSGTVEAEFGEASEQVPQITWGVEDDGDTIVVRHEAGDATPASHLYLRDGYVNGRRLSPAFEAEYSSVGPGASVSVDREEIEEGPLTVMWENENSELPLLEYSP